MHARENWISATQLRRSGQQGIGMGAQENGTWAPRVKRRNEEKERSRAKSYIHQGLTLGWGEVAMFGRRVIYPRIMPHLPVHLPKLS